MVLMKKLIIVLLLLANLPAYGHDLWIEHTDSSLTLYYGHRHSGHHGPELIEYSPGILIRALCFDENARSSDLDLPQRYPLIITKSCAVIHVLTSSGYWTKTPYGTKNITKDHAQQAVRSWLSYESVKRMDTWNEKLAVPLTQDLELTPINDPFEAERGDKLRLLVTYRGKPVKGAIVSYMDKPRGVTGDDGKINVRLQQNGFQVIQASYHVALQSEKADEVIYTTNLNFELKAEK
jgi:nickel transport protein